MMFLDGWLCLSRLYACNSRGDGVVDQCETVSLFLMDCHMVRFFKLKKWVSKMYQFLKVDARCRTIFVKMLFYWKSRKIDQARCAIDFNHIASACKESRNNFHVISASRCLFGNVNIAHVTPLNSAKFMLGIPTIFEAVCSELLVDASLINKKRYRTPWLWCERLMNLQMPIFFSQKLRLHRVTTLLRFSERPVEM